MGWWNPVYCDCNVLWYKIPQRLCTVLWCIICNCSVL
jgi:hypothetical protein